VPTISQLPGIQALQQGVSGYSFQHLALAR